MRRPEIQLVDIDELRPHESIIPSRAAKILASILQSRTVYKPILVEATTMTVIDGHHRLQALRTLGARYAPVLPLRYDRDVEGIGAPVRRLPYRDIYEAEERILEHARRGPLPVVLEGPGGRVTLHLDPLDAHTLLGRLEARGPVVARPLGLDPYLIMLAAGKGILLPPRTTIHGTWGKEVVAPVLLEELF